VTDDVRAKDHKHSVRGARTNFLTLIGQTTLFGFAFVVARLFGPAVWGAYSTAYQIVEVLVRSSQFATDKAVLVFVPARRAKADEAGAARAVGAGVKITVITAVLCAIGMAIAAFPVGAIAAEDPAKTGGAMVGDAMLLLAPAVVLGALSQLLLASTMAAKVLRWNFVAKGVVEPLVMFVCALGLGLAAPSLLGLTIIPVIAGAIVLVIAIVGARKLYAMRDVVAAARTKVEREIWRFCVPLAAAEALNILAMRLGTFVLVPYAVDAERGVFTIALMLASTVSYVRGMFDTVLGPLAAEAWSSGDRVRLATNLKASTRMVLLFVVPYASLYLVGGEALLGLLDTNEPTPMKFVEGYQAMIWLALANIVNATLGLAGWVLMAALRTRAMLLNNVAKLVVELVLCLMLIPWLGITGAAIATAVAITTLQVLQVYEVYRLAGIHPFSTGLAKLATLGTLVIGAELAADRLLGGGREVRVFAILAVGTAIYFAIAWRWRERGKSPA
jgi:O-antigen/teichoic acid export membrane protein